MLASTFVLRVRGVIGACGNRSNSPWRLLLRAAEAGLGDGGLEACFSTTLRGVAVLAAGGAAALIPLVSNGMIFEAGRSGNRLRCGDRLASAVRLTGTRSGAAARLPATTLN